MTDQDSNTHFVADPWSMVYTKSPALRQNHGDPMTPLQVATAKIGFDLAQLNADFVTLNNIVNPPVTNSPPVVEGLDPAGGSPDGGTLVTIAGAGFTGAAGVAFGGVGAAFAVGNDTTITATAPAHPVGVVDVTVTTPGGTSATGVGSEYAYAAPAISPDGATIVAPNGMLIANDGEFAWGAAATSPAGNWEVLLNGSRYASGAAVRMEIMGGVVYALDASGNWWKDNGTHWVQSGAP